MAKRRKKDVVERAKIGEWSTIYPGAKVAEYVFDDPDSAYREMCSCGHEKSQHAGLTGFGEWSRGAGACKVCECGRFCWVTFLDKDGKPTRDPAKFVKTKFA
jgi:hypothetical protein